MHSQTRFLIALADHVSGENEPEPPLHDLTPNRRQRVISYRISIDNQERPVGWLDGGAETLGFRHSPCLPVEPQTSPSGQKRKSSVGLGMSVVGGRADIYFGPLDVCS